MATKTSQANSKGAFRRALRVTVDSGYVLAELEDDVHHFRLGVRHDNERILAVEVDSPRTPWVTCVGASAAMERLVGRAITWPIAFADEAEKFSACTHLIDLANLAVGRIGQIGLRRRYDIEIAYHSRSELRATLIDHQGFSIDWTVIDDAPNSEPCKGIPLGRIPAALAGRPAEEQEAILALRRAVRIGGARYIDLDEVPTAAGLPAAATCYTLLPDNRDVAYRNTGTTIDFWGQGRWPLDGGNAVP